MVEPSLSAMKATFLFPRLVLTHPFTVMVVSLRELANASLIKILEFAIKAVFFMIRSTNVIIFFYICIIFRIIMRKKIFSALFLWALPVFQGDFPAYSQVPTQAPLPSWRTEFISYDIRGEADADLVDGSKYFRALRFSGGRVSVEIPALWLDRDVYIRDTGRGGRYKLLVNGHLAATNSDSYGGGEWHVTNFLTAGTNYIALEPTDEGADLEKFTPKGDPRGIYLFSQPRIHIADYIAAGRFDAEYKDAVIDLKVLVINGFNMTERVRVGYDIYDPTGQLKDFAFVEADIAGRSRDTVRLIYKVTGTQKFKYSAANPALYRVTLSLRHEGRDIEYIPFRLAFDVALPSKINAAEVDFPSERGAAEKLRALKKQGFNAVEPMHPQQRWFYDLAAREGVWVIDRASIECDPRGGDRTTSGTAANDPALVKYFIDRQAAMFYRRRNYPNIVGWSIGAPGGNGYNMYKSYQYLKALDPLRPVIYRGAEGEWNTDGN